MPRTLFERELHELQDGVLTLGSMTEQAIQRSVDALERSDLIASRQVVDDDPLINRKRFEIEEQCIHVIATQAPIASDLRAIVAVLNIVTDLERMADHAEGIGRINLMMTGHLQRPDLSHIPEMAEKAIKMLHGSLSAFVDKDVEAALAICEKDDEVDALYDAVYADVIGRMIADPSQVPTLTYVLWSAHNIERIADRATNICERVIFLVTGHMDELNVSRY